MYNCISAHKNGSHYTACCVFSWYNNAALPVHSIANTFSCIAHLLTDCYWWLSLIASICLWQWHQLGHMQICTSPQTDNQASIPPLSFLQTGCPSCCTLSFSISISQYLPLWHRNHIISKTITMVMPVNSDSAMQQPVLCGNSILKPPKIPKTEITELAALITIIKQITVTYLMLNLVQLIIKKCTHTQPGWAGTRRYIRHLLDFLVQNEDNTGRCTQMHQQFGWTAIHPD